MLTITLPDQSTRQFEQALTVGDVAANIGSGLAKAAVAGKVDGQLVDTSHLLTQDCELAIITSKDAEGVDILRHGTAHLLAQAIKELFPTAQITIGPVIEHGFYYDISYKERSLTPEDLTALEKQMKELAKQNLAVERFEWPRDQAIAFFREQGESYKAEIIEDISAGETLTLYKQGEFTDLCRGPHIPRTSFIKAFKLTKLAGAYWRGDSNNEMLQRIYGVAFANKQELNEHLERVKEAEKRDHRKIAKEQDLFHTQEEAPGMIFWHPNGWSIYQSLERYMRGKLASQNYQEIKTPILADKSLWEKSGHWEKFKEDMFITESESRTYAVKPMSCPCHVEVFKQGLKSYRDLPLRFAEFGHCHRNEASGTLHGLLRVRSMVQDDGHIFCMPNQIQQEVTLFNQLLDDIYQDFGFTDLIVYLSTRPEKRFGSDEQWDHSEKALADALDQCGVNWRENPGEGAFYGPKVEYSLKDCLGRIWQVGTLQLDYILPERLGAHYVAEDGSKQVPVMLHRAVLGTFERFIGILIEHYAGKFPTWLAPTQAVILNISQNQQPYCQKVTEILQNQGFRVKSDLRNEKVGFKIREHTLKRIPYQVVIGDREVSEELLSVRHRNGDDLGQMTVEDFSQLLTKDIAQLA